MRIAMIAAAGLLASACQGTIPTYGYRPLGSAQSASSSDANAACLAEASDAKSRAAADIWAQGGEPAYHRTYAACMKRFGWERFVASSYRYG